MMGEDRTGAAWICWGRPKRKKVGIRRPSEKGSEPVQKHLRLSGETAPLRLCCVHSDGRWVVGRVETAVLGGGSCERRGQDTFTTLDRKPVSCSLAPSLLLSTLESESAQIVKVFLRPVFNVYFSVVNFWLSSHIWLFRLVSSQLIGSESRSDPARCSPQQHVILSVRVA
ncbi:hypothetical protein EYF80_001667 [Liparis tanakae]|uniref:Uncharacterized protein n=1 Tax=Liparis tanakae TaxID=230148 RepID=A0A4Z2JCY4_9TELE|nr:hypothetical protein EYF80_001667 [Liparis tanakae]